MILFTDIEYEVSNSRLLWLKCQTLQISSNPTIRCILLSGAQKQFQKQKTAPAITDQNILGNMWSVSDISDRLRKNIKLSISWLEKTFCHTNYFFLQQ